MYFNVNRWTSSSGNYDAILRFNGLVANGNDPKGHVDAASGGTCKVYVKGWAFDKDCIRQCVDVHVYFGGECHVIKANTSRFDVNSSFLCANNHGFEANITTSKTGSQPYQIYAINSSKGNNILIGSGTVNIVPAASIVYSGHVQNYGWMAVTRNGATADTTGQSLRVEALRVRLVRK